MKHSSHIDQIIEPKNPTAEEGTAALLTLLAMGNREIEEGKFKDAEGVFAEMDTSR